MTLYLASADASDGSENETGVGVGDGGNQESKKEEM